MNCCMPQIMTGVARIKTAVQQPGKIQSDDIPLTFLVALHTLALEKLLAIFNFVTTVVST